ncbi:MAG TPA: urease accessory protein UreE [Candidatus Lustribacter sp.]|jgi:urease accessory protein|nr:urease accessory protein UreE [Candidatus Lustribacter sp.]
MFRRIDAVLGNLRDFPLGSRALERLPVASSAMTRRLLRLPSSIGDLGLLLDGATRIRDGDVLVADDARVIAIEVVPDDVLIAYPDSIAQAVEIAHALGNRHIPVLREGDAIVVGFAAPLEELFERSGVRFERVARVLERPFVYAHAPHTHA